MNLAIVLAGSLNEGLLRQCSNVPNEALIKIGNKCMVEYVVEGLMNSKNIDKIIIVGPSAQLREIFKYDQSVTVVEGGKTIVQSLLEGLKLLEQQMQPILITTSDIPLITGKIIDDFLERCFKEDADVIYPIIDRTINEARFPGVERTYVKLLEGTYTGGNIFYVKPRIIKPCAARAEELISLRKSPIRLANYIGILFILKYLLKWLSVEDVEKRVSKLFNISGKAINIPFPEIGIDVDKPSDLEMVKKILLSK